MASFSEIYLYTVYSFHVTNLMPSVTRTFTVLVNSHSDDLKYPFSTGGVLQEDVAFLLLLLVKNYVALNGIQFTF